jgi:inorganic pyrophosphatase
MTNYAKLPTWADRDHVYAAVETPRGSRAKLEFDPKLGAFEGLEVGSAMYALKAPSHHGSQRRVESYGAPSKG